MQYILFLQSAPWQDQPVTAQHLQQNDSTRTKSLANRVQEVRTINTFTVFRQSVIIIAHIVNTVNEKVIEWSHHNTDSDVF